MSKSSPLLIIENNDNQNDDNDNNNPSIYSTKIHIIETVPSLLALEQVKRKL
jgi:hypothetical protein